MLGIPFRVTAIESPYMHRWGNTCENAKPVEYQWTVTVNDVHKKPTSFCFDLVDGDSPMIIGLNLKKYSDTINRGTPNRLCFKRPSDNEDRVFYTYIAPDEGRCDRLRLEIVPHYQSSTASLMGNIKKQPSLNMVKKIHRFSHGTADEMKQIFSDAGMDTPDVRRACERVFEACEVCVSSGRPANRAKVSLTHVQADFVTVYIRDEKYEVLNMVDMGTRYGERFIAPDRNGNTMMHMMESLWVYRHGAPKNFSADPEFCRPFFKKFLTGHDITLYPRPSRSSSKNGVVERNNGTFKIILSKLSKEKQQPHQPRL